ncbi:MAG: PAS domain S-box protein [Ignavibacteria bacterium]|nr:PAS domain S-box protein [Ignavibacteria bacterium]
MNLTGDKKKILVVEDDITLRDNICEYLEECDFDVTSAGDGLEGLEKFRESLPDLVLCDIAMPKLDGFQLFQEIRSIPEYSQTPFIFLTAKIGLEDFQKGMNLGADDYIIKPFNFEQLISIIKNRIIKKDERLKFNREKYRSLIENSLTGVFIHQGSRIIYFNSRFRDIFGLPESTEETEFKDIIDSFYLKELNRKIDECYNGIIQNFSIELKGRKDDGSEIFIEMFAGFSIFNDKKALLGNILDITYRHKIEQKLKRSEKRYKDLLNLSPISIHEVDLNGKILFVNEAVLKSSGYSLNEIINKYIWDFTSDKSKAGITKEVFLDIIKKLPDPKPLILNFDNKAGKEITAEVHWGYTYNEEGKIKGLIIILYDITEMEKSRIALSESEQKFRSLTEIASDWIWEIDEKECFTYTSQKVFDVLGYMPEELYGKKPREIMPKFEINRAIPYLEDISKNRKVFRLYECEFLHKNGRQITLEISGIPYYDNNGEYKGYIGISSDVSRRKKSQTELQSVNSKLSSILHNINSIVLYETGAESNFYSENIKNLTGIAAKQFLSKKVTPENLIHPEDVSVYKKKVSEWEKSKEQNLKLQYRLKKSNDRYILVEDYKSKFFTDENKYYTSGILVDVTERKQTEEDIQRLNYILDSVPVAVLILDDKFRIIYTNKTYSEITGYTKNELQNNTDINLLINRDDFLKGEFKKTLIRDGRFEGKRKHKKKNGEEYYEYFIVSSVKNNRNEITHYIILKQDITGFEKMQKELSKAYILIEETNQLKNHILSNLSLEFRTPLNAIFGYSEILSEEITAISHKNMIAGIRDAADKLHQTLEFIIKLMQFSYIDDKEEKKEIDIIKEINKTIEKFREVILSKNLYLNINIKPDSIKINGNAGMIRQIFFNLIDNAVKHTNRGGITVNIEKFDDTVQKMCTIRISDTGTGIPEEKINNLFKDFGRLTEELDSNVPKIGLGLTIVKKMVEFHNGSVSAESIPGECTTFTVVLPAI